MTISKTVSGNIKPIQKVSIWKPLLIVAVFFLLAVLAKVIFFLTGDILPAKGVKILDGLFIFFSSLAVLFFIRWLIVDAPFSFLRRFTIIPILKTLISLILYFIAAVYLLHRLAGIDLTPLLTTSAVLTGIIALSLQETFKNLFTGIWINSERIVKKGDWVKIAGKKGQVMDVTWRTTRLLTFNNDYIYLPNKILSEGDVENYTHPNPLHIVEIDVGTSYKDPPNKVKAVLVEAALQNPYVLKDPSPEVLLLSFGDFSIKYQLRVWIDNYGAILRVRSDLQYNIWYVFKRNGIEIPFPTRKVHQYRHEVVEKVIIEDEITAYLRGIDLFQPLSDDDIKKISQTARMEIYGEDETIFKQGDKGDTCYFVKEGTVEILVKDEGGGEGRVATLRDSAFFGEMSLLTGEDRSATAVARKDTLLIVMDSQGFSDVFVRNPDLMEKLSEMMTMRSSELEEVRKKAATEGEFREVQKRASKILLNRIRSFFVKKR